MAIIQRINHSDPMIDSAQLSRKAALEAQRRELFQFFRTYDLVEMSKRMVHGFTLQFFRAMHSFTAAVLLGQRAPRTTGGRLSDTYGNRPDHAYRGVENVYLSEEQLDEHIALVTGVVEYGADAALQFRSS